MVRGYVGRAFLLKGGGERGRRYCQREGLLSRGQNVWEVA